VQIVYEGNGRRHELDLTVNDPDATVADLVRALAPDAADRLEGLVVGGRLAGLTLSLEEAGLHEGAVVTLPCVEPASASDPVAMFEVVGGVDAGHRWPLTTGEATVGRHPDCDAVLTSDTVSGRHLAVEVDGMRVAVRDLGSHNGTWVDGEVVTGERALDPGALLQLGAVQATVRAPRDDDRPLAVDPRRHATPAGTIPFNRPPRSALLGPPLEIHPPAPPDRAGPKAPFNVAMLVTPIIFGVVMVMVLGSWLFAMFAILTPMMVVGNWLQGKRTDKRKAREDAKRFARELAAFTAALSDAHAHEVSRRRGAYPDLAEVARRASQPSTHLWERRPSHADFLALRLGTGDVPWRPPTPVVGGRAARDAVPEQVEAALAAHAVLPRCPVDVSLADGGVVGIVGERTAALALARALVVQAAVHHGPANLPVAVLASEERADDWDWAKWLPHTRDPAGGTSRLLSGDRETSEALLDALLASHAGEDRDRPSRGRGEGLSEDASVLLVVLDDESLTHGRRAPARSVLRGKAGPVAGIVLASAEDRLPAVCTAVVRLDDADGLASRHLPLTGDHLAGFLAAGLADAVARETARALARFEDPELEIAGAGLPPAVRLLPLLGLGELSAEAVAARWKDGGRAPPIAAPVGVDEDGVFVVDLVRDGPHGLVAGTTGSGKSELLRSLVAGLATNVDPDHLTFVLVDYKGGAAFDQCARLPHTVGMVTDLDAHLGERALRCLEAELHHREKVLRAAGAQDLLAYLADPSNTEPMPRLVVVIDEFATMAAELPDFIDALVGIAQRGRSLGVHMILATQRPSGAVNENIKANTNLRVALRVQDAADSSDVIGVGDAAHIARGQAGRAYVRLGPGEIVPIQTALSTAVTRADAVRPLEVAPFRYGPAPARRAGAGGPGDDAPTDLERLVDAIRDAFASSSLREPRKPWPEPLPGHVDLYDVVDTGQAGVVGFALADDPERQSQYPVGWRPADGNLIVYGIPGAGTTTALASIALALARIHRPDELHLYALDFGAGELAPLAGLPHTGAVVTATERERQLRLVRQLVAEVARRRGLDAAARAAQPRIVVALDGYAALRADFDNDAAGLALLDDVARLVSDGPDLRLNLLVGADRSGAVPAAIASLVRQKLLLRLADAADYSIFGVKSATVPDLPPGRGILADTGQLVQVARPPGGDLAGAVARVAAAAPEPERPPAPVGALPTRVDVATIAAAARLDTAPWRLPLGIGEQTLAPACLELYPGEHGLVAGPARSGRTTVLRTIARVAKQARPGITVIGVSGPRSHLDQSPHLDAHGTPAQAVELLTGVGDDDRPHLVLIDDAELVDDSPALSALMSSQRPGLHVVAAARADALRTLFSHWTKTLRAAKVGVLLVPDVDLDGDLLGARLPRQAPAAITVGRGYLVSGGHVELVQAAR